MAATEPHADVEVTELVRRARRVREPMDRRRRVTEGVIGAAFLVAALAFALLADAGREWDAGVAVVLVAFFAVCTQIVVEVGAGATMPVQLAFVPMLFLIPTPWVPLLVAGGWFLGKLWELRGGGTHPDRLLLVLPNGWFAMGPALVLVAFDAQTPEWSDWPVWLLALAAQFVFDAVVTELREVFGLGIAPRVQFQVLGLVQAVDTLLSPLGVLAAFASRSWPYAFTLLVPAAGLLLFYARERASRLTAALALADAARDRQELIASASHELVTPLGILVGLTDRLAPGRRLDEERREQVHAAMSRELVQLRQLVRQFVDYTRLKTDRELHLRIAPSPVRPVLDDVASALATSGAIQVVAPDDLVALADSDRLHQMVMGLAAAVLRSAPAAPEVHISARGSGETVDVVVSGGTPGSPTSFDESDAAGIGLHVTRELALAHGGDVRAGQAPDGGTRYTLTLPRAAVAPAPAAPPAGTAG